ncbi:MAG: hypothetical protein AAF430_10615 [Myxococcota bacterium]
MNTPAHVLVNLAVLDRWAPPMVRRWIAAGAVLPDLPMFFFYAWQRVLGRPDREIWGSLYFEAGWQHFFDAFNSVPIFLALAIGAYTTKRWGVWWLSLSVLLHCLGDAFLHREDGHRHLWPLSDARFMSPVSYWDPAHHGVWGNGFETFALLASVWLLWPRFGVRGRALLGLFASVSIAIWLGFYVLGVFGPEVGACPDGQPTC